MMMMIVVDVVRVREKVKVKSEDKMEGDCVDEDGKQVVCHRCHVDVVVGGDGDENCVVWQL